MGGVESTDKTIFQVSKHSFPMSEERNNILQGKSPTPSRRSNTSRGSRTNLYSLGHLKEAISKGIRRKGGRRGPEVRSNANAISSTDPDSAETSTHFGLRVEGIEELMSSTKFSREELQRMYRGFKNECPTGVVDKETFKRIYAQFFPYGDSSLYAQLVFNVFDQDGDGRVSFEDFVSGISVSLYGSREEKMKWTFQLYDLDGDGIITREELATVIHSVHCMMGLDSVPSGEEMTVEEQVERLFGLMDKNEDGVISEMEFLEGCEKDESIRQSLAMFDSVR